MDDNTTPPIPTARPLSPGRNPADPADSAEQFLSDPASAREPQYGYAYPALAEPEPMTLPDMRLGDAWADLLLVFVAAILTQFGLELFVVATSPPPDTTNLSSQTGILWVKKALDLLLAVTLAAYLIRRNQIRPESFGLSYTRVAGCEGVPSGPLRVIIATGLHVTWAIATLSAAYLMMALFLVIVLIIVAIQTAAGGTPEIPQPENPLIDALLPARGWPLIGLFTIVAAHEELIFRALLIPLFRRITGSWVAAICVTSLIFAVLHLIQGWIAVGMLTLVGAVFAVFFVLTRSVVPVILAHLVFNTLQIELAQFVMKSMKQAQPSG